MMAADGGTIKEGNVSPLTVEWLEDFRNCNFDNGGKADLEWQPAHFDGLYGVVPDAEIGFTRNSYVFVIRNAKGNPMTPSSRAKSLAGK